MDLNPPFTMEDQTDEDFFDKLVDDEFGGNDTSAVEPGFINSNAGDDSDEAKTFGLEDSSGFESKEEGGEVNSTTISDVRQEEVGVDEVNPKTISDASKEEVGVNEVNAKTVSDDAGKEDNVSLVLSNSVEFDNKVGVNNDVAKPEVSLESSEVKNGGSGVKEVQWNALFTNSGQNESHGFGSYSDFFSEFGANNGGEFPDEVSNNLNYQANDFPGQVIQNLSYQVNNVSDGDSHKTEGLINDVSNVQFQESQAYGAVVEQSANEQDMNSSQYWDNLYPGWRYDLSTGQWYQVDGYAATENSQQGTFDNNTGLESVASNVEHDVSYLKQMAQSVAGSVTDAGTTESVSNWNQVLQENTGYPEHMVFDPQYPGWYYDTIAQEWCSLESYTPSDQLSQAHDQHNQNGFPSADLLSHNGGGGVTDQYNQSISYGSQGFGSQLQDDNWGVASNNLQQNRFSSNGTFSNINGSTAHEQYGQTDKGISQSSASHGQASNWGGSLSNYNQLGQSVWQPAAVSSNEVIKDFGGNQQVNNFYGSTNHVNNHADQMRSYNSIRTDPFYEKESKVQDATYARALRNVVPGENVSQQFNPAKREPQQHIPLSNDYFASQKSLAFSQQSFQGGQQFSNDPSAGRSSAGRPPHTLVTFGFGGKLIVTKDNRSFSSFGDQNPVGGSVSVLNLMEVISEKSNASSTGSGACDYFHTLCQQSFPGPLVGGNIGNKELNKWIDERIANCGVSDIDFRKGEILRLLLSLLKIACQHYGKLRSPFGSDTSSKGSDTPESAVANLFASVKRNSTQVSQYGALTHCLQTLPSEGQLRATASEVQNLLVSGRKKDALDYAVQGQLWGPALVIASQLSEQFYADAVKQMALRQLVPGSPLRTLCLLIARQPQAVFSSDNPAESSLSNGVDMYQQTTQYGANSMLDDWEENLAVISANRTKDDELVIINLGDCLWRDRSEILAAHICYLVAEANFEPYSESSRLCLIGSNHLKYPRTYASPEAIQRTELYEYSKVLGNSQFILLPFQPYKLIYAYMLAEVGKISDSLKYCQATLKSLKTGRTPEVELWRQLVSSLEERIRTHQQGGYSTNLAPAKLVGKLLNFFDSTAHRVVGGLPPPGPSATNGSAQSSEQYQQSSGPRVTSSQSTMAMSSLMPSPSTEQMSEWKGPGNRMTMHNRSISEPDIGRTPRHVDPSKETTESDRQGKTSVSGGSSRFVRFGFGSQLLQKTVGLVLKSRTDRQAKLGESNKFYYDEKLKRWVEEGSEPPAEEAALPPPPTSAAFQNGMSDFSLRSTYKTEGSPTNRTPELKSPPAEPSSGIPPIPPGSSHFSARGRMGVRSRYVDTFNQGGGTTANLFQSPSVPSVKHAAAGANAKFFVPAPMASGEQIISSISESFLEGTENEDPTSDFNGSFQSSAPPSTMQRHPSMDNIPQKAAMINGNSSLPSHSRRTASWGGSYSNAFSPPKAPEVKPLGEMLGISSSAFMPSEPSSMHLQSNGGSFADELHEVEL